MKKTIIIAEAGVNHNGDINIAKKLIDFASISGVDYIKFQTFKANKLVSKEANKADYQKKQTCSKDNFQFNMLKKLELSEKSHYLLIDYCKSKNIKFLSSAFDVDGLDFLDKLNLDYIKIPSGEITNYNYLKKVSTFQKKVILSTGMSTMDEIKKAIDVLISENLELNDIIVLHCNTDYPTPFKDVNLSAMNKIKSELGVDVGYSDHTLGIEVSLAAVSLGARVIEKHFTLDKGMDGPDHKASLMPEELKELVRSVRNIELSLSGNGIKEPSSSEKKNIIASRKSLFFQKDISKNQTIKKHHLKALRPGNGISPMEINKIIGMIVKKDFKNGEMVDYNKLK